MLVRTLFLVAITGFLAACEDILAVRMTQVALSSVDFVLVDEHNSDILTSRDHDVKIYYFDGREKQYIRLAICTDSYGQYHIGTNALASASAKGFKTFYLESRGDTDTLYVDAREVNARRDHEGRPYRVEKVVFNGQDVEKVHRSGMRGYYKFVRHDPHVVDLKHPYSFRGSLAGL